MQRGLLEGEGIVFDFRDRIDLKRFQWQPKMVAPRQRSRKKSRQ
jgi:hypothetical protein